jgi:hypothetical protein
MNVPFQMSGVVFTGHPSFGASSFRRALDSGMRHSDVLPLVLPLARREIIVSGDVFVKVPPTRPVLSPILSASPPNSLEGGIATKGVVMTLGLR